MDLREAGQGPYPQKNLAYDLTFFHTADHTAAAVNGGGPMVTQDEIPVFRHLIGEPDVAFAHGQRVHIGLVQHLAVYRDHAVHVHIDHITGLPDDALEQQLVLPVKPA